MVLDGTYSEPQADPIVGWRIVNVIFDLDSDDGSAIAQVGYYRQSGARDSIRDLQFRGDAYAALIAALANPVHDESDLKSLAAIYRRRVAAHVDRVLHDGVLHG